MPVITKSGRDLHASPTSVPPPQPDDETLPQGRAMVELLLKHQAALASTQLRTLVIQVSGDGKMALKATFDL
jgi:hypothetical protein